MPANGIRKKEEKMNDIGGRDIEDYLRDLISDGFGRQVEEPVACDDQPAGGTRPNRSSSHPVQPSNPGKGRINSAHKV